MSATVFRLCWVWSCFIAPQMGWLNRHLKEEKWQSLFKTPETFWCQLSSGMSHTRCLIVCFLWHVFVFLRRVMAHISPVRELRGREGGVWETTGEPSLCFIASHRGVERLQPSSPPANGRRCVCVWGFFLFFFQQIYAWVGRRDLWSCDSVSAVETRKTVCCMCVFQVSSDPRDIPADTDKHTCRPWTQHNQKLLLTTISAQRDTRRHTISFCCVIQQKNY